MACNVLQLGETITRLMGGWYNGGCRGVATWVVVAVVVVEWCRQQWLIATRSRSRPC